MRRSVSVEAREVLSADYMEDKGIDPHATARIPIAECCGRVAWDCECPRTCPGCRDVIHGPWTCPCGGDVEDDE